MAQPLRSNVWELGDPWAEPVLWYARGVGAMQQRALAEPTSWRFYAAIHGFDQTLWTTFGYLDPPVTPPSIAAQRQFWNQCQHGSWYFLPWHRGYLLAFEATVRAAVVALGGPADWALPYWNYLKAGQSELPPAFGTTDWPDGPDGNPLFVSERHGPQGDGHVHVPTGLGHHLDAMDEPEFTGVASGGSVGFGGVVTDFNTGGSPHGGIERQPHDWVHGQVGGQSGNEGLMSRPRTAGLDPIFWLHHANIDRLWESWRRDTDQTHVDPTDLRWIDGPLQVNGRRFVMPMPDGTTWQFTPGEVTELAKLGYAYDDLSPDGTVPPPVDRRRRRRPAPVDAAEGAAMAGGDDVELVGANRAPLPITGSDVRTAGDLAPGARAKVSENLSAAADDAAPDRVFLNLENVRGLADSTSFHVFVGLPDDADPDEHPDRLAGSVALFGVSDASEADGEHAGDGLTYVLEITRIVDAMFLDNAFDLDRLEVRIVPTRPVPESAQVTIGRVSIFRQGR